MAKTSNKKTPTFEKVVANKYPSNYGSHKSMVVEEWTEKVSDPKFVVLQDDNGFYATERTRLDSGLADPYRYVGSEYKARLLKELLPGVQVLCQDDKISMKAE